jgi:type III secretion protein Q
VEHVSGDFVDALRPLATRATLPDALAELRVPGTLRLFSRMYPIAVLRSVKPGDVLLGWRGATPSATQPMGAPLGAGLRWGTPRATRFGASVIVDGTQVHFQTTPAAMDNELPAADSLTTTLNAMEVTLHVELAALDLSLTELAALQAGSILQLPTPLADAEVQLVSYGQHLGTGRLVAVGDHLGVQVTRFATAHE